MHNIYKYMHTEKGMVEGSCIIAWKTYENDSDAMSYIIVIENRIDCCGRNLYYSNIH